MQLINLTPHTVTFITENRVVTVPPSGQVARVEVKREVVQHIEVDGAVIPVHKTVHGPITGLPDPQPGVMYIVSILVAQAARRDDVVAPDELVRDAEGRVVGARALARA